MTAFVEKAIDTSVAHTARLFIYTKNRINYYFYIVSKVSLIFKIHKFES